ncbi:hypothetical protein FJZ18_03010 [Candidatus Pacearchaeota archaeon]|nr:hypothetical protein [Candidatus Pacearchaeota archaeon]
MEDKIDEDSEYKFEDEEESAADALDTAIGVSRETKRYFSTKPTPLKILQLRMQIQTTSSKTYFIYTSSPDASNEGFLMCVSNLVLPQNRRHLSLFFL